MSESDFCSRKIILMAVWRVDREVGRTVWWETSGKSKKGMRVHEPGEQQEGWKLVDGFERGSRGGLIDRHNLAVACL